MKLSKYTGLVLFGLLTLASVPAQGPVFPLTFNLPTELGTQVPNVASPSGGLATNTAPAGPIPSSLALEARRGSFRSRLTLDGGSSLPPNAVEIAVLTNRSTPTVPMDTTPVGFVAGTPAVSSPIDISLDIGNPTGATIQGSLRIIGSSTFTGGPTVSGQIDTGSGTVFTVPVNSTSETVLPLDLDPSGGKATLENFQVQYPSGTSGAGSMVIRIRFEPYRFQSVVVAPTSSACSGGTLTNSFKGLVARPIGGFAEAHDIEIGNGQPGALALLAISNSSLQFILPIPVTACGLIAPIATVPYPSPLTSAGTGAVRIDMPVNAIGPVFLQALHLDPVSGLNRTTDVVQFVF